MHLKNYLALPDFISFSLFSPAKIMQNFELVNKMRRIFIFSK